MPKNPVRWEPGPAGWEGGPSEPRAERPALGSGLFSGSRQGGRRGIAAAPGLQAADFPTPVHAGRASAAPQPALCSSPFAPADLGGTREAFSLGLPQTVFQLPVPSPSQGERRWSWLSARAWLVPLHFPLISGFPACVLEVQVGSWELSLLQLDLFNASACHLPVVKLPWQFRKSAGLCLF